jgi:hypothetical protein
MRGMYVNDVERKCAVKNKNYYVRVSPSSEFSYCRKVISKTKNLLSATLALSNIYWDKRKVLRKINKVEHNKKIPLKMFGYGKKKNKDKLPASVQATKIGKLYYKVGKDGVITNLQAWLHQWKEHKITEYDTLYQECLRNYE